jgi:GTPase SAR1 family protein
VLVVGTKGAGKSTFVTRFFKSVLPRATAERCVVVRVDLGTTDGDVEKLFRWLDRALLDECESTLFTDGPSFAEIEGMFFDEYQRLRKGPWKVQYDSDKPGFQARFGDRIEQLRHSDPGEYVQGLIRHIVNSRKSVPVLVFDNADHFDIEYQQRVYQYARSIYERAVCLVLLPITDRTSVACR